MPSNEVDVLRKAPSTALLTAEAAGDPCRASERNPCVHAEAKQNSNGKSEMPSRNGVWNSTSAAAKSASRSLTEGSSLTTMR